MKRTVQLSLSNSSTAAALRQALERSGPWQAELVAAPDLNLDSVVLVGLKEFLRLPKPLANPEQFVLMMPSGADLNPAWEAGVVSVVSESDDLPTVLLAIMAAALRADSAARHRQTKRDISQQIPNILRH
jgi:hypothetical protein